MLKKQTNKDVLKEILAQRAFYSDKFLTIKYKKFNEIEQKNFLVVPAAVSKKAVARNKIKRRSREILREAGLHKTISLAVFFKKGSENLGFKELKEKLLIATKNIK